MKFTLKLFATLTDFLPPGGTGNQVLLDLADGMTVGEVIDCYKLPRNLVHLVLVNGAYVAPDARATHLLKDGDQLAIWPPIAGG